MINYNRALEIVLKEAEILPGTEIDLLESLDHIIDEEIVSDRNYPPFDQSRMDGFAIKMREITKRLKIIGEIPAGKVADFSIKNGECAKIMTGAMLPQGADCVVMVEKSSIDGKYVSFHCDETDLNLTKEGANLKSGELIVPKGTLITPQIIGNLAAVGASVVKVTRKPKVAIITSGDELVTYADQPQKYQIRDSNLPMLQTLVRSLGMEAVSLGISPDSFDKLFKTVANAIESQADLILVNAAMSMGDYDFGPKVIAKHGFQTIFEKIAFQPGKPTLFAKREGQFLFGVPGNTVSTFTVFHALIKPFLLKLSGKKIETDRKMILSQSFKRKNCERTLYQPIKIENNKICPLEYHNSSHLNVLTQADGWMVVPQGINSFSKGDTIDVRLL